MGKPGRPPHPDILTPREWQVLALLREGLTNEQIAQRLDVSLATTKYHVSEILSKLGVTTREEAAAWQPPAERGWLDRALAPLAAAMRRLGPVGSTLFGVAAVGVVLLTLRAWSDGGEDQSAVAPSPASPLSAPGAPSPTVGSATVSVQWPETAWTMRCGSFDMAATQPGVHVLDAATCVTRRLTSGPYDWGATWAPDNSKLAFLRSASQGGLFPTHADIFLTNTDGNEPVQLTATADIRETDLRWSPDGSMLAFVQLPLTQIDYSRDTGVDSAPWTYSVSVMSLDGPHFVRPLVSGVKWPQYDWSPDGQSIVINTLDRLVLVAKVATGESMKIADDATGPPSWSYDGRLIAYQCFADGSPADESALCTISPDGSGHRVVAGGPTLPLAEIPFPGYYPSAGSAGPPTWEPGRGILAFAGHGDLYIVDPYDQFPESIERLVKRFGGYTFDWLSNGRVVGTIDHCTAAVTPCAHQAAFSLDPATGQLDLVLAGSCGVGWQWSVDGTLIAVSVAEEGACPG